MHWKWICKRMFFIKKAYTHRARTPPLDKGVTVNKEPCLYCQFYFKRTRYIKGAFIYKNFLFYICWNPKWFYRVTHNPCPNYCFLYEVLSARNGLFLFLMDYIFPMSLIDMFSLQLFIFYPLAGCTPKIVFFPIHCNPLRVHERANHSH